MNLLFGHKKDQQEVSATIVVKDIRLTILPMSGAKGGAPTTLLRGDSDDEQEGNEDQNLSTLGAGDDADLGGAGQNKQQSNHSNKFKMVLPHGSLSAVSNASNSYTHYSVALERKGKGSGYVRRTRWMNTEYVAKHPHTTKYVGSEEEQCAAALNQIKNASSEEEQQRNVSGSYKTDATDASSSSPLAGTAGLLASSSSCPISRTSSTLGGAGKGAATTDLIWGTAMNPMAFKVNFTADSGTSGKDEKKDKKDKKSSSKKDEIGKMVDDYGNNSPSGAADGAADTSVSSTAAAATPSTTNAVGFWESIGLPESTTVKSKMTHPLTAAIHCFNIHQAQDAYLASLRDAPLPTPSHPKTAFWGAKETVVPCKDLKIDFAQCVNSPLKEVTFHVPVQLPGLKVKDKHYYSSLASDPHVSPSKSKERESSNTSPTPQKNGGGGAGDGSTSPGGGLAINDDGADGERSPSPHHHNNSTTSVGSVSPSSPPHRRYIAGQPQNCFLELTLCCVGVRQKSNGKKGSGGEKDGKNGDDEDDEDEEEEEDEDEQSGQALAAPREAAPSNALVSSAPAGDDDEDDDAPPPPSPPVGGTNASSGTTPLSKKKSFNRSGTQSLPHMRLLPGTHHSKLDAASPINRYFYKNLPHLAKRQFKPHYHEYAIILDAVSLDVTRPTNAATLSSAAASTSSAPSASTSAAPSPAKESHQQHAIKQYGFGFFVDVTNGTPGTKMDYVCKALRAPEDPSAVARRVRAANSTSAAFAASGLYYNNPHHHAFLTANNSYHRHNHGAGGGGLSVSNAGGSVLGGVAKSLFFLSSTASASSVMGASGAGTGEGVLRHVCDFSTAPVAAPRNSSSAAAASGADNSSVAQTVADSSHAEEGGHSATAASSSSATPPPLEREASWVICSSNSEHYSNFAVGRRVMCTSRFRANKDGLCHSSQKAQLSFGIIRVDGHKEWSTEVAWTQPVDLAEEVLNVENYPDEGIVFSAGFAYGERISFRLRRRCFEGAARHMSPLLEPTPFFADIGRDATLLDKKASDENTNSDAAAKASSDGAATTREVSVSEAINAAAAASRQPSMQSKYQHPNPKEDPFAAADGEHAQAPSAASETPAEFAPAPATPAKEQRDEQEEAYIRAAAMAAAEAAEVEEDLYGDAPSVKAKKSKK